MAQQRTWDHGDRESRHKRGYGRQHVRLRAVLLQQEPLCRLCKAKGRVTAATIADHIVPIAKGGAVHDLSNMQPVCAPCHNDKSLRDQGKRVRPRIAADGWPIDE
jgi:5-methylcytosine-specific restriction protein A